MAGLGSDVALLDILDPQVDLAGLQSDAGGRIKHYKTDVTQKASMESAVSEIVKDFGRVNNCITAAGITLEKPFIDHEWEECRRVLDINVMGSYFCAQLVARQMIKQNSGGSIVMIASVAAHCAVPAQRVSMYGASKAAIKLLGKTLGVEMAPYNIRVNTLSPGYIATEMTAQFKDLQGVFNRVPPLGRIGQRDDLTMAVAYLLSDGALYTTGADIVVSGGLHNGRIDV
ncbi:hypothetical protein FQN52_003812 [Onygenales sp. PD_12]|nr:hypothetical protein FQN53_006281 [Emmonsiellopsis sp. PD_33]KAK2776142.1 hypothetical protein FQN52_003812 [Onygenales sp. PD_12]KAK2792955.1 hypothetical protein FQN51_001533 [Onygenales sp. PD_10]